MAKKENAESKGQRTAGGVKPETISDTVYLSEYFHYYLRTYFSGTQESKEISKMLNDRIQPLRNNIASYRQVNSWDEYGLLDIDREGGEWRKFSIMDALWIHIIYELRCFGYTIDLIKKVKESLSHGSKEAKVAMPFLQCCTCLASTYKVPVVLLVFVDGSALPMPYEDYKMNVIGFGLKNHIRIDLNMMLQRIFPIRNFTPIYPLDFYLSYEEAELLSFSRMGDYERIEVKFKNKKMEIIEGTERIDVSKRIVDILKEKKFQSIELIKKDGRVVSIIRKIKKKIGYEN